MKTKTFDENDIILTLHDLLEAVEKEKKNFNTIDAACLIQELLEIAAEERGSCNHT